MSQQEVYLFKAIGGYFVNFYFNTLYKSACTASNNSHEGLSITDTYRSKVSCYIQAIKSVESAYKRLVSDLHRYCVKISTRFNSLTFSQFINQLVLSFIPADYAESLSASDKDELFSVIISDLAATLGSICTRPEYLRKIIDNHDDNRTLTCEILFKESMRCLENQKDMMMNKFIREISQAKDYISSDAANQLRILLDERDDTIAARNEEIAELRYLINEHRDRETKMRRMIDLLQKNRITIHKEPSAATAEAAPAPPSIRPTVVPSSEKRRRVRPIGPPPTRITTPPPPERLKSPTPAPLTSHNLVRHTIENVDLKVKPIDEKVESNIMNSIRPRSARSSSKHSSVQSESSDSGESGTLTSGKNSLIDNIDGLLQSK